MTERIKTLLDIDKDVKETLHGLKVSKNINPSGYMRDAIRARLESDGHLPAAEYKQFRAWFRNPRGDGQLQSEIVRAKSEAEARDIYECLDFESISIEPVQDENK